MILEYAPQTSSTAVKVAADDTVSGNYFGSAVAIDGALAADPAVARYAALVAAGT